MANTIKKADFQDALDITNGKIMVNWEERGFITELTIDGKAPEDLINCISWTLRRRKPRTTERSCWAAVLYNNINSLSLLAGWVLFQIVVDFTNPDTTNPDNIGQTLVIAECRVQDHSISITESSTYKMSGRAKERTVTGK